MDFDLSNAIAGSYGLYWVLISKYYHWKLFGTSPRLRLWKEDDGRI